MVWSKDLVHGDGQCRDMRIWENKIHRGDPVLCEADEYVAEFSRWAKPFYSDPA